MGRNSKKNKGRKPMAEQGLKEAASLASASTTNVTTAPSHPARTAKHKVRKFPPQPTATSSTQTNDSPKVKSSQSLKEPQPVLTSLSPDNQIQKVENQEAVPSYTSATRHCESPPTLNESPEGGSSSTEREVALHQPISSDSYDTSSSSTSETGMGFKNDFDNIPETHNVADMLKINVLKIERGATEQTQRLNVWQQEDKKPKGVDADKFASIPMVAMENKEVQQRAAGVGHSPQMVAVPDVKGPFTSLSTCLHDKLEVSELLYEQDVEAQADDASNSFEDGAIQENIPPQQVSHLKQESLLETETPGEDSSSGPAIARKEKEFMDAKPVASEQSSSWSETTVVDASITFCTSSYNLKQNIDQEELELVDGSFDKGSEEDKDKTSAEEAPPCSIHQSASTDVHQQVETNARELVVDILQRQESKMSEQSNLDVVPALEAVDLTPSLQSEEGKATIVVAQHTHVEVEQNHEPEELNRAERGTVEDEMQITDRELQPLTEKEHSITSIQDTVLVSRAESLYEAQQNLQEMNLSASLNEDGEAQETNEENSLVAQILERQEVAAQSVVPEEVTTFGKHNLLDSEQNIKELGEPEAYSISINTRIEWQEKPDKAYVGSADGVHTTSSAENEVEKLEVSETEAEDLTPEENKEYQTEVEKLEVVEVEVHSIIINQEECQEEEPDKLHSGSIPDEHKTRDSLEDKMEKPHVGEPQAESVPLDKDWEYQEEKPQQVYSESVCKEDPRSLEKAIKQLDAAQEKEFEEKSSQLDDIRSCVEKKPEVTKLKSALFEEEKELQEEMPDQVDGGYVCKEDETSSVEKQLENKPDVDNLELHRAKENQEEETDLLDRGAECEGHTTDSVESDMEKLQVGEPEVEDFTLDKEDYLQEQPDHTHGECVSQEHILITNSLENGSEDPDVPWVGGVTLHKYRCHEDEPDQQFDRGLVVDELNSVESELENIEVRQPEMEDITLQKNECPQEKSDHAHCGSICQEDETTESLENYMEDKVGKPQVGGDKDQECQKDKTTDSLENAMEEFNMGNPQVGGDKDHECHEDKFDQQLDLGTACEEHSTNFIESETEKLEVREPEAEMITLNIEECQEKENEQVHSGSVCEDNKTRDSLKNVENPDSQASNVMLDNDQVYQEEKPGKVDRNSVSQDHTQSSEEHDIEKLKVEELEIASLINQERDCQAEDIINSVEDGMEQSESEVESATLEKKESPEEIPDQVDRGYACEEHEMHSMENQLEKPEVEEPEVEGVALHKDKESQEDDLDQLEREALCEGHAKPSEMETVKVEKFEAAVDKEECEEEKYQEADVDSLCEEHPEKDLLEHAMENPNVGDPQVEGVMHDKHQGLQEELPDQVDSDYVCEEHPISPVDNEVEKLEAEGLENTIAVEERECQEEDTEKIVEIGMEQSKPEVESAAPEDNKESLEEMPSQIRNGYECNEHEMQLVENELEKSEVGEPEVEGGALHKVKERRENELDKPIVHEGYAKTGVECEKEGEEPEVALSKEEGEEQKHHHADGDFLYEEPHQTDILEHAMEEPVMEEPQVEGAMLDKDQESSEDKPDRVSSESVCQEHPASSTENERGQLEDEELEKATTIEDKKECLEEDPTKSVENEIEVECAVLEEKTESPEEMSLNINSGHVHDEHDMQSIENEEAKPEEGEAEVESVALPKKKTGQEDELGQLERGAICEGDAENSVESQLEKLEVMPELDKEESENHQVTDILEHAMDKPDVQEPQVEGVTQLKDQKLQKEVPDQVCSDSASQEEPTSFVENEVEQLEVGDSEKIITDKEDKDCHEELTTKSVDNEMEQPKLEEESASPFQEKKDSPEDMPDQTDSGCEHEEHEKHSVENGLEKLEVAREPVESVPLHDKKESHEDALDQLERGAVSEGCTKNSAEHDMEKLEVVKPEVSNIALDEEECEEGKHDLADSGSVGEEHQATDTPDVEELPVEGVMLEKDQELPEDIADQVDSDFVCQEQPASSMEIENEKLEMGESQIAIAIKGDKECQEEDIINSVDDEIEEPKQEVNSATLEEKKESSEQMPLVESVALDKEWECQEEGPEQVLSDSVCGGYIRSAQNEIEKLEVGESKVAIAVDEEKACREGKSNQINSVDRTPEVEEPEVESAALEEKDLQAEMPYQVVSGYICKEDETNSMGDQLEKEPEVGNVAFHEEKASQEDKPGLLDRGTICEGHAANSSETEMEVWEPEVRNITLDKGNLQEALGQDDATNPVESETEELQVGEPEVKENTLNTEDGRSVCEEHEVTDFPEHAMEKPDVEEPHVEGATLEKAQESPEEKLHQAHSDSACKELAASSLRSEIEKLEVGEREYQEEGQRQFNVCAEYDIENVLEKPEIKEPEVQSAALEENKQRREEKNDQVESDCVCNEHETESVKVSEVKDPELERVALYQIGSNENKAEGVSCCPDEQLITDSEGKGLEILEVGETRGPTIEEKEDCQPAHAHHPSCVSEEQAPKSVKSDLDKRELGEPEAGSVPDKVRYQEEEPSQVHRSSTSEEHTANLLEDELENPKLEEPEVDGVKLDEERQCQEQNPANVESPYQNTRSFLECEMVEHLNLEEPEAAGAALDIADCQEEEPCQLHTEPLCEEQKMNSLENEMEKLEVGELAGSVKLDKKEEYQEPADIEQTTSSLESEKEKLEVEEPKVTLEEHQDEEPCQLGSVSTCEEPDVGKHEVDSAALEEKNEWQEEGPDHVDSGYEEQARKSGEAELEGEPDTEGVTLDEMCTSHEDKDQIGSSSEQPAVAVEHEMGKLEVGEPQEKYPVKEEREDSDQLSSGFAETEVEVGNHELQDVPLDNEQWQKVKPDGVQDDSKCKQYSTRSEEDMENLEEGDSEIPSVVLDEKTEWEETNIDHAASGSVYEEQTSDFEEKETKKSEVGVPEVEDIMLVEKEIQSQMPDQMISSSVSEKHSTDSGENDMDKFEGRQPELGDNVALEESQEKITDEADNGSACATTKPELVVALEEEKECQGGKPDQVNGSRSVSEAQTVDSVENETEKPEVDVPEVQDDVLAEKECHSEKPDQDVHSSVHEEHATDFLEDEMVKLEVNQPEVGKRDQFVASSTSASGSLENGTGKTEVEGPEIEENVLDEVCHNEKSDPDESSYISEEHATDAKKDDKDELEAHQPEDQVVANDALVREAHTLLSLNNETEMPEVGEPEVKENVLDQEYHSEKSDKDQTSSVHEEHATDLSEDEMGKLEENQPEVGKPDQFVAGSTSASGSLENGTEKTEVEEQEIQENGLDEVCHSEKHDPDESSYVCEEHATDSKKDDKDELEAHQPEDQVVTSDALHEAHTVDPLNNETEMPEVGEPEVKEMPEVGAPEVKENVLDQECHSGKPDEDETSSVFVKHAADFKEDVKDELEASQSDVEKPDQVVVTSTSESEAHTLESLESETEKTEGVPELEDNVLEQHECLGEKPDQKESSFVCKEHAADSKQTDKEEPEVNQPEGRKPYQVVTDSTSVSEVYTLDSLMNETGKPEERVPETEDKALEQKECLDEKHDQDESGSVCGEYGTDSKEADLDKLEVNQPDQGSTGMSESHTLDSLENEAKKPEDGLQQVEDNVLGKKECLGEKPDRDEKRSICDEHATDSKDDSGELEMKQLEEGEPEQVLADGICLSEAHALDTLKNETEKPMENETEKAEEGVPEVEDNVFEQEECHGEKPDQDKSSSVCEEHATNSKKDTMGNVEGNQPEVGDQVVPGSTSLSEHTLNSLENETQKSEVGVPEVEDDGLASRQEGTLSSEDDCSKTKEEQEAETVNFPVALNQENRAIEPGLSSMARDAEQTSIHNFCTGETGQDQDLTDVPAEGVTEEIGFRQPILMSHAPKHQEGPQEILSQLDTAKPEEAKQEPMHHLKSNEEDQEVHLTEVPATLAPAELQAQEAIHVDEGGLELFTTHTIPSDVKEMYLDIKQHEDGPEEQHSPQSVLQKQESPAEDNIKYGIHAVAATNAERLRDKDVQLKDSEQNNADEKQSKQEETSAALVEQKGDFRLEEPVPICIPLQYSDVKITAPKTEPAKENLDEAFLCLATPGIACSSPSILLPLPL